MADSTKINQLQEKLLEANSIITNKIIEGISFDKTITCNIIDDTYKKEGKYIVSNGAQEFTAYSTVTNYSVNNTVYVTIPNGNYENQKIIIGKKTSNTDKPFVFTTPFDTMVDLTGNTINGKSYTTTITSNARVNKTKDYTITSYLIYTHKFGNGSTTAISNKVNNTITVHEPLNNQSLKSISLPSNENWVWSNAVSKDFTITPTFDTLLPYSYEGQYISDSTTPAVAKGYIQSSTVGDITGAIKTLTWHKTTGGSTDLKTEYANITIKVKSTEKSAPSAVEIADRTATIQVRNAVTGLSGLADKTLYAGSTAVTESVTITPAIPFSKELILVNEGGQDVSGNSITSTGKATVTLKGQTITLDASKVTPGTATQTIKFKVRSRQSNAAVDTGLITFTVNAVTNITGKTVVEGESITVAAGIGDITSAVVTSGPVRVTHSAGSVTITGTAVDNDTPWVVTVTNAAGAHITVSGTTTYLTDVSTSINTGDFIVIGTDFIGGLGATISSIVTDPSKGKASIVDGKLKYEASTKDGPIAAGKYAIKVKGVNGATRTVNITVSNITAELS